MLMNSRVQHVEGHRIACSGPVAIVRVDEAG
jgi:hypothetical protein